LYLILAPKNSTPKPHTELVQISTVHLLCPYELGKLSQYSYMLDDWHLIPGTSRDIFLFATISIQALGTPSLSYRYWGILPLGYQADHSPPSSTEVKNAKRYTCTRNFLPYSISVFHEVFPLNLYVLFLSPLFPALQNLLSLTIITIHNVKMVP
jgi:hypothetical protein